MKELINITLFKKIEFVLGYETWFKEMAVGITLSFREKMWFGIMLGPIAFVIGAKKAKKS